MNNIELTEEFKKVISIKVVGIGGGGGNVVSCMYDSGMDSIDGVELITINTDYAALRYSKATRKLHIGDRLTHGLGAVKPEIGEKAVEENREEITAALKGADMVIIIAGMGGGTGTGAAPIVAEIARDMGCLTVGVVTQPYKFEGQRRFRQAEEGIARLKDKVDTLLIVSGKQLRYINPEITLVDAYTTADEVLCQVVQVIFNLLINPRQLISLDFADVISVMRGSGFAYVGLGQVKGESSVEHAAKKAMESPLMEKSICSARGILVNFQVSPGIDLKGFNNAAAMIFDAASEDVYLLWGVTLNENMEDDIKVTIIATDFEEKPEPEEADIDDEMDLSNIIRMLENR